MLFNSAIFVFLFLPIVWIGYVLALRVPWARAGIAWLGLASIFFYGYWNPAFVPLLVVSILFNYGVGRLLDPQVWNASPRARKGVLAGAIASNLAALGYYKYAGMLVSSFGALTGIAAPVFDVAAADRHLVLSPSRRSPTWSTPRRGRPRERRPLAYVLFVTFFPHLIAGPIVHHAEMMPQFAAPAPRHAACADLVVGLTSSPCGLAKKVLFADSVAPAAEPRSSTPRRRRCRSTFIDAWIGALAYTLQLYFDFSGYSDMAIGLALHVRHPPAAELRLALQGALDRRVLAALAHDAVALPARLPLHPARAATGTARRAAT